MYAETFEYFIANIFYSLQFYVFSGLRARASLARPTHYINLAVMAAPPDAESLESRISEYFKLIPLSQCCPETCTSTNYCAEILFNEMTADPSSAGPSGGDSDPAVTSRMLT